MLDIGCGFGWHCIYVDNVFDVFVPGILTLMAFGSDTGKAGLWCGNCKVVQKNHYLSIIEAESKRLSALSDNLLKLSALETGVESLSFKEYRLDKQLEEIALMLEPQRSAKSIAVEADLEKLTIQGDEGLLSQVWVNLMHNAVKIYAGGRRNPCCF